jgi:hypothetical protein
MIGEWVIVDLMGIDDWIGDLLGIGDSLRSGDYRRGRNAGKGLQRSVMESKSPHFQSQFRQSRDNPQSSINPQSNRQSSLNPQSAICNPQSILNPQPLDPQ